jgi:glycosyl transferase family 25
MNFIDAVVIINLDRRPDRLEHVNRELQKINELDVSKIHRFAAIDNHLVGCLSSHLGVLQLAKHQQWKNVLILEDDFTFIDDANSFITKLHKFWDNFSDTFGFVQLTSNCSIQPDKNVFVYPHPPQEKTTNGAGYFVHSRCYNLLIDEFEKSVEPLRKTGQHWNYANDMAWNNIRDKIPTFIFVPRLGHQYANFSDLSLREIGCQ